MSHNIPFHPLANLFPLIEGPAFDELVADVREHGIREKITLLDGQVLDGRNRLRAGIAAGRIDEDDIEFIVDGGNMPWLERFYPHIHGDPLAWVLSRNLHRRHLSESQRTLIAAEIAQLKPGRPAQDAEIVYADKPANRRDNVTQAEAAELLNVSERSVQRGRHIIAHAAPEVVDEVRRGSIAISAAEEIAKLPVSEQLAVLRGADPRAFARVAKERRAVQQAEKAERRAEREEELGARQKALPNKRYGVILADPEWKFEVWGEAGMDRAADNHYPTSDTETIKARDVLAIAADDCVLLLWVTVPMLQQGLDVMAAWGFAYKSHFVWEKDKQGTGYWNRNEHELLLVGTRGDVPAPAMGTQFSSVQAWPVGEHSEKPPFAHEIAERHFPSLPKIELNARARRDGWDAWGLEAPGAVASGDSLAESAASLSETPVEAPEAVADSAASQSETPAEAPAGGTLVARKAMSRAECEPILVARYRTEPTEQLSEETGVPVNTLRTWAHRLGLTSKDRIARSGKAWAEQRKQQLKQSQEHSA